MLCVHMVLVSPTNSNRLIMCELKPISYEMGFFINQHLTETISLIIQDAKVYSHSI